MSQMAITRPGEKPPRAENPWVLTLSGRAVDLVRPDPETIDFVNDVAPHLASLPRFNGAARAWFVSDHLVHGAGLLRAHNPGNVELVAQWLLHDAHEAYIGDIITPVARALEAHAEAEFAGKPGYAPGLYVKAAIASLKKTLDHAIHRAAGVALPDERNAGLIRRHDLAMLVTEANHLLPPPPRRWGGLENIQPLRTQGALKTTGRTPEVRAHVYLAALQTYCPQALRRCLSTPAAE